MVKTGLLSGLEELGLRVYFIWNYKTTKKYHLFRIQNV